MQIENEDYDPILDARRPHDAFVLYNFDYVDLM